MELSKENCESFKKDPTKNPKTGRIINKDGPVYKNIDKLCKVDCKEWRKEPTKDPETKRKLDTKAKTGIYTQLVKLCGLANSPVKNMSAEHKKLISAVKKVVGPILNKGDSIKSRIQFYKIMQKYLTNIKPCIEQENNKLYLYNTENEPLVEFQNRIGNNSAYGMAFMNMGKGFAKLLKFSCKLMASDIVGNKNEVKILEKMTKAVLDGKSPNMPITYKTLKCNKKCIVKNCPEITKKNGYFAVINELATCDLQTWLLKKYNDETYQSIVMQLVFAIHCFHMLGYNHNDCHLKNFLIHDIAPGGYWRYQINGENVYVPNCGYLLVMWDPGQASPIQKTFNEDYSTALSLLIYIESTAAYISLGLKAISSHIVDYGVVPILNVINYSYKKETDTIFDVVNYIKTDVIKFNKIQVGGIPPDYLLNITPYNVFK
jgi:hypothetical protein